MKGLSFKDLVEFANGKPQKLSCPKCCSEEIQVQLIQTEGKTKTKKRSGARKLGRGMMITATGGLWGLTRAKKETSKMNYNHEKMAVCQTCGHSWYIK